MNNLFLSVDDTLKVALFKEQFLVKYSEFSYSANLIQELISSFKVQKLDNVYVLVNSFITQTHVQQAVLIDHCIINGQTFYSYCTQNDYNKIVSIVSNFNFRKFTVMSALPIYKELLKSYKTIFYSYGEFIGALTDTKIAYISLAELKSLYGEDIKAGNTILADDFISKKINRVCNINDIKDTQITSALSTLSSFLLLEGYSPNNKMEVDQTLKINYEYTESDKFVDEDSLDRIVNHNDESTSVSTKTTKKEKEKPKRKLRKTIPCACCVVCCALVVSGSLRKQISSKISELKVLQEHENSNKELLAQTLEQRKQYCAAYGNTQYLQSINTVPKLEDLIGQYSMSLDNPDAIKVIYYTAPDTDLDKLTESLSKSINVNEIIDHGEVELKSNSYRKLTLDLNTK